MEDKPDRSIVDFFRGYINVKVHVFDNLNDVFDSLNLCSGCSSYFMHFILFFNLKMVGEDIIQFLGQVKEHPDLKTTPVFILSESGNADTVRELYKCHLNNFIMKPEDSGDLGHVLGSFMKFWFDLAELP
jgi:DNA-binding NarL/FixJ family response regulator